MEQKKHKKRRKAPPPKGPAPKAAGPGGPPVGVPANNVTPLPMAKGPGKKRKKSKKRRRNRRGPGLLIRLFCLVLICGAILAAVTVFFKVKDVKLVGETRYGSQVLIDAAGVKPGVNLFFINKIAMEKRIRKDHPYLDEVVIRRRLPDTLEISVTESVPAVAIQENSGWWLMDRNGKLLEEVSYSQAQGSCMVSGCQVKEAKAGESAVFSDKEKSKALVTILNTAENSGILKEITAIDMEKVFEIRFQYAGRFTVELGTVENIEKKIQFLLRVVPTLGSTDTGTIDLTDSQTARFRPA